MGSALPRLKGLAPSLYRVSSGGQALAPVSADVGLRDEDGVGFKVGGADIPARAPDF